MPPKVIAGLNILLNMQIFQVPVFPGHLTLVEQMVNLPLITKNTKVFIALKINWPQACNLK